MSDRNYPENALGAINTSCTGNHSDAAIQSAVAVPTPAQVAMQIARLKQAGHVVHRGVDGGYLVCKYGYTHHAQDFAALQCFARRLGVQHEL
jgi:RsiW-degrading membrane proteinase PrsW (M82 family)